LGNACAPRAIMFMPKAPMHEDDFVQPGKGQVGFSGKVFAMKPESISHPVNQLAHNQLRFRVAPLDGAHDPAARFCRFFHRRSSIFRLGSVSNSSTIALYRLTMSVTAGLRPSAANLPSS